jgi:methylated-DNA-protein-cysteine methyltransferase-like protein
MEGSPGKSFYRRVYEIAAQIPSGFVCTYGQLALLAGSPRASRQVGRAMSMAPAGLGLPCHRVVNHTGRLAPGHAFGAQGYQRLLLESEGVTFLPDGRIDMGKHAWHGESPLYTAYRDN